MAKNNSNFLCEECGSIFSKWAGRCNQCGAWDSIIEEPGESFSANNKKATGKGKVRKFELLQGSIESKVRIDTGIKELNRVLGGGLVEGSAILLGGDPGIGKSTLVLQILASLAGAGKNVAYISGEESIEQVRLRAHRLKVEDSPVKLTSATNVEDILASVDVLQKPDLLVIDSIQTVSTDNIVSAPGTVSQVRACSHELISYAKNNNIALILVGHVTKEGQIAGPKILEHMVDTVLYFEGERGHQFRILRAVKNRFGPANEIGVFEMQSLGLVEVPNPSSLFLSQRGEEDISGVAIFAGLEGTRPILIEIQALVAPSPLPTPRRAVVGWDQNRLAMIIAVLQMRYGIFLADKEIYLNVVGGLKIVETAADLAVAAALISSFTDTPIPHDQVIFGELGLSGEVRAVSQHQARLKEADKLGFKSAILPANIKFENKSFILQSISHIRELRRYFYQKKPQKEPVT